MPSSDEPAADDQVWLVLRAQTGDRGALDALLRAAERPLAAHVRRLVGQDHDVRDVLQDSFVIICRKIGWLRDPRLFTSWAYRIATREAWRSARRDRVWGDRHLGGDALHVVADEPHEPPFDPELLAALPDLVARLPPASRVVIALHYLEDMTIDEVATELDVAIGTVKSRLAYGLSVLRRLSPAR